MQIVGDVLRNRISDVEAALEVEMSETERLYEENRKFRRALLLCHLAAGSSDVVDGLRSIRRTIDEALGRQGDE
jgi:hypothetical protein